jgi:hypothetical protein
MFCMRKPYSVIIPQAILTVALNEFFLDIQANAIIQS